MFVIISPRATAWFILCTIFCFFSDYVYNIQLSSSSIFLFSVIHSIVRLFKKNFTYYSFEIALIKTVIWCSEINNGLESDKDYVEKLYYYQFCHSG
jgi:hypothetical protein